jgi:4-hydroxy-2-oxoglutarate aldolase
MKLQGIFADITTPFDHNGDIYKVKVQHNVEKWNLTTLAGYVVCGAAGEGDLLSDEEKVAVWEMVAQHTAAEKVLIAAVAEPGVRDAVTLINRAAELGYKAAFLTARHAQAATRSLYFRSVADQAKIPVILDSECPEATTTAMAHPNVIACIGRPGRVYTGVQTLAGSASDLWPALEAGAAGAILDFAAAAPYACIAIWEAHRTRENEAGIDWQSRIARAAGLVSTPGIGVAGLKHAMDLNAYYGGPPRLPFIVPDAKIRREIEEAFSGFRG